jgi:phenylalanyl-tRNA synthetase beta chain
MKASYRWLRELLPGLDASPSEVAARLTGAGIDVEGMVEYGEASSACVVVRVLGKRAHPTKSGLTLVTVDRGGAQQEVVCGAPNVPDAGGLCVLAPLGAHLPAKGVTIEKRTIAGVASEGMLVSESELGLSEDHAGILVLAEGTAEPGTSFAIAVPNARDTIFEISLTPNRPDALGHVGLAREVAAVLGLPFRLPETGASGKAKLEASVPTSEVVTVTVDDPERCPQYGAAGVLDVKIGPSPLWLKYRLHALGVRSISNVVDVTNLVMLEYGHPMHAFDLARVRSAKIVVRRAAAGEKLLTLDGVERTLVEDDLLICDGDGPVAMGGIMGGASSEIKGDTRRVLFECAFFDPRGVRRSARRHAMHTESSHRFERGVDPGDIADVLDRAVALTISLAGGTRTAGRLHVQGRRVAPDPLPPERRTVTLRARRISELLGMDVPFVEAISILERLGCEAHSINTAQRHDATCDLVLPSHRPDLAREVDLIEEILRVHGIDHVQAELPRIRASRDVGGREELMRRVRTICAELGLSEAIVFGFTSPRALDALSAPPAAVVLANPLTELHSAMRTTLLPGLLDAVGHARRHGERDVREFTVGPVFLASNGGERTLPDERLRVAFVLAGDRPAWLEKPKPFDVWDAKGYALEIARRLSRRPVDAVPAERAETPKHLHPRGAAFVLLGDQRVGSFGPIHPDVADALGLEGDIFLCEMELDPFAGGPAVPRYAHVPRFPASSRDIALVVKDGIFAGEVERLVRDAAGALAEDVCLFDRFVGGSIPAGFSSLAFRVVYRAADRTLTDAEVDAAHANVVKAASDRFGATLRQ